MGHGGCGGYKLSISSEILDAKSISDSFVCILQYLHRLYWLSISNLACEHENAL